MLILKRVVGEAIVIDLRDFGLGLVRVLPVESRRGVMRLGIEADAKIPVHREEIFQTIEREGRRSA